MKLTGETKRIDLNEEDLIEAGLIKKDKNMKNQLTNLGTLTLVIISIAVINEIFKLAAKDMLKR